MTTLMKPERIDPETLRIIQDALARFVDGVGDLAARRTRLAQVPVNERLHWATLAELGVFGVGVAEAEGGLGGGATDLAEVVQALARALLVEPWAESAVLAASVLRAAGAVGDEHLQAVQAGTALAVQVGGRLGRSDALQCQRCEGGWRVSGPVAVVLGAACADTWLLAAQDAQGDWQVFAAPVAGQPVSRRDYRLMDGRSASDLAFDGLFLPEAALLLSGPAAAAALDRAATLAALVCCADAVGVMAELVKTTREYLVTRVQFGVTIGSFQALQHRLADMHMAWLEARAITRALAASADADPAARQAWLRSAALTVLERTAPKVAHEAIQMHGGMGVTEELVVSHYNARLVVLVKLLQAWVPKVSPLCEVAV